MRFSFFATLACLAFSQAVVYNDIEDRWSFDINEADNADWMSTITDSTRLSSLAIPGTHNSVTYSLSSKMLQTQNMPLKQQLIGGIRYLDITCKHTKRGLMVYHGVANTEYSFGTVISTIFNFLNDHQRETVILRIQMGGVFKSSKSFINSLEKYLTPATALGDLAADRVYSKGDDRITTVPTLGELRGKVFILEDFKTSTPGRFGLPWNKDTVSSYSRRFSASTLFLDSKWEDIKSHLDEPPSDSSNKLRITHTTASFGVNPINFAARNAPDVGMNHNLGEYLGYWQNPCYGIIAMDFPGWFNVQQILKRNQRYQNPQASNLS